MPPTVRLEEQTDQSPFCRYAVRRFYGEFTLGGNCATAADGQVALDGLGHPDRSPDGLDGDGSSLIDDSRR